MQWRITTFATHEPAPRGNLTQRASIGCAASSRTEGAANSLGAGQSGQET